MDVIILLKLSYLGMSFFLILILLKAVPSKFKEQELLCQLQEQSLIMLLQPL